MRKRNEAFRVERSEEGLSVIELVVAMGITLLVIFLSFLVFEFSIGVQKDIQLSTDSTSKSQLAVNKITKSIRTASAVRVPAANRLEIKTSAGTCELYAVVVSADVEGRQIIFKESDNLIPGVAEPRVQVINDIVRGPGEPPFFEASGSGVNYAFRVGKEVGAIDLRSYATPRSTITNTSPCW